MVLYEIQNTTDTPFLCAFVINNKSIKDLIEKTGLTIKKYESLHAFGIYLYYIIGSGQVPARILGWVKMLKETATGYEIDEKKTKLYKELVDEFEAKVVREMINRNSNSDIERLIYIKTNNLTFLRLPKDYDFRNSEEYKPATPEESEAEFIHDTYLTLRGLKSK